MKKITQKIFLFGILSILAALNNLNAVALINNTNYEMFLIISYKEKSEKDVIKLIKDEAEIIEITDPRNNVEKLTIQILNTPYILFFDLTQILDILSDNQTTYLSLSSTYNSYQLPDNIINDWKKNPPLLKPMISSKKDPSGSGLYVPGKLYIQN